MKSFQILYIVEEVHVKGLQLVTETTVALLLGCAYCTDNSRTNAVLYALLGLVVHLRLTQMR